MGAHTPPAVDEVSFKAGYEPIADDQMVSQAVKHVRPAIGSSRSAPSMWGAGARLADGPGTWHFDLDAPAKNISQRHL